MKNIILDHFRRWWWIWLLGGLGCQALVLGICLPGKHEASSQVFPAIIFLGSFMLSVDLQRGHARAVLAMPVTIRQIARAWWVVSVGIPSLLLAGMCGLGFVLVCLFGHTLPSIASLSYYWLVNSLLLGANFFALTGLPSKPGPDGDWIERARGLLFGLIWGASFGGWFFLNSTVLTNSTGSLIFITATAILSILGWFRAETLVLERAGLRKRVVLKSTKPSLCMNGYGGLHYLFETIFLRMLRMGVWFFAMFTLIIGLMFHGFSSHADGHMNAFWGQNLSMFTFQFLWFMSFQMVPVSLHIRFLRTLPVSASKLAALLVFTPLIAMVITLLMANVFMALVFHSTPTSLLQMIRHGWLIQTAVACTYTPMLVWRGMDRLTYLVVILIMIFGISSSVFFSGLNFTIIGNILAPPLILVSFLATRYLLKRGSETYRPRTNQLSGWGWAAGR